MILDPWSGEWTSSSWHLQWALQAELPREALWPFLPESGEGGSVLIFTGHFKRYSIMNIYNHLQYNITSALQFQQKLKGTVGSTGLPE